MALALPTKKHYHGGMRLLSYFVLLFIFTWACPAQAQSLLPKVQRVLQAKASANIVARSQQSKALLFKKLGPLLQPTQISPLPAQHFIPKRKNPISFLVQTGPQSQNTATAFALNIRGTLVGVTAGHVMDNIQHEKPYMSFPRENKHVEFPITSWLISNRQGSDVAVFKIPDQARDYIEPLEISSQEVKPWQTASIAGYTNNSPIWLQNEEILFVGHQRLLLRNTTRRALFGMCGSPVMIDGKVAGLYVGYNPRETLLSAAWAEPLREIATNELPSLHQVAPVEHLIPLVETLMFKEDINSFGTIMKVFDFPVAILKPQDRLFSISHLRDGQLVKIVYPGPLTEPEHLEQFFDLQENDEVFATVFPKGYPFSNSFATIYRVNVSTGEVKHFRHAAKR